MDLTTYLTRLHHEAAAAAALGGDEARDTMDRLLLALSPAIRLTLLEAVSDAAAEISADLPTATVDTRLRGAELEFVIETAPEPHPATEAQRPPEPSPADTESDADQDSDLIRITLRLPGGLKSRAEDLAQTANLSLNSWLIDAVRRATRPEPHPTQTPERHNRRMSGWA